MSRRTTSHRIPVSRDVGEVDLGSVNLCGRVSEDGTLILGTRMVVVVVELVVVVVEEEERFVVDGGMTGTEQEDTPGPTLNPFLALAPPHLPEPAPSSPSRPPPSSQSAPFPPFQTLLDPSSMVGLDVC